MDNLKPQFNLWFLTAWFGAAFTTLILSILTSFYLSNTKIVQPLSQSFKLYAALPGDGIYVEESIEPVDARSKIIENLFRKFKSPLADKAQVFVSVSDKYRLDYKLLPAIAMQESKGGQKIIKDSYNPFGYGIYGSLVIKFSSWEEAVERVGRSLREDYLDQGLKTPTQIMAKYTPPSLAKGGGWAKGVSHFMQQLQ